MRSKACMLYDGKMSWYHHVLYYFIGLKYSKISQGQCRMHLASSVITKKLPGNVGTFAHVVPTLHLLSSYSTD